MRIFCWAMPQETTLDSAVSKSYLRDNVFDALCAGRLARAAQSDAELRSPLRVFRALHGEIRSPGRCGYESWARRSPERRKWRREDSGLSAEAAGSLVFPFRTAFAPRLGLALRLPKQTVVRAGFGMNYTVGQYATFATTMAHQPPFANEQTNEATASGPTRLRAHAADCLTLANGFPAPDHDRQLCSRSALSAALCAGVESRCAEDAALGHRDERRLQRVEGQSSGHHQRAARHRQQPDHATRPTCSSTTSRPWRFRSSTRGRCA